MKTLTIALLGAALLVTTAPATGAALMDSRATKDVYEYRTTGSAAPARGPQKPAEAAGMAAGSLARAVFPMPEGNGHVDEP